ncbi:MAG: hflK [Alphaproteobacteria bacterium]|jgi:membrane protease subunit HflK|nr:hflK [Alphaproteobacteria bacterium]
MALKSQDGMILLPNQGPWGNRPGNDQPPSGGGGNDGGGNSPWGQRPQRPSGGGGGGGGGNEPDLDAMLRQAQDRFKSSFGNKRPGSAMEPSRALAFLIGAVVLVWLASGFYTIQPEENAVVLTFGKMQPGDIKTQAGLGYRLPYPIQSVEKENVAQNRQLDIGFTGRGQVQNDKPTESSMLTGDENIVKIHFSVFWKISDLGKYIFSIEEPQVLTVQTVAESAMREIIARTPIQSALTEGRGDIEAKSKELMQKILDGYDSGVSINSVQLLSVDPPNPVVDAFNDVQRARTDKERLKNEANTYRNDIIPVAKGQAERLIREAEGYKEATIAKAKGDAERFNSVYKAYAESKDITQKRLYLETMQEVLKNSRKIITGDSKGAPLLPLLQLDGKSNNTAVPFNAPPQPGQ